MEWKTWEKILESEAWAITSGGEFRRQLESAAIKGKVLLIPTHTCTNFTQAQRLVVEGLAAAVLPDLARFDAAVCRKLLPWMKGIHRAIGLAWYPRNFMARIHLESAISASRCIAGVISLFYDVSREGAENGTRGGRGTQRNPRAVFDGT